MSFVWDNKLNNLQMISLLARKAQKLPHHRFYGSISHNAGLTVDLQENKDRKTKIVCTVGPASWHEEGIRDLLVRGMNVLRLNFSHGSHEDKERVITDLRTIGKVSLFLLFIFHSFSSF